MQPSFSRYRRISLAFCLLLLQSCQQVSGIPVGEKVETASSTSSRLSSSGSHAQGVDVVSSYLSSPLRVLTVIKNPFTGYYLTIATPRQKYDCDGPCENDESCGGMYNGGSCFFFEEPGYVYQAKPPRFIDSFMSPNAGTVQLDTIRFIDEDIIEFSSFHGDGGYSNNTTYQMNLTTGKTITTMSKENHLEE